MKHIVAPILICAVCGCSDQDATSEQAFPVTMTEAAVGHYCQMNVLDHDGPKAQVHLAENDHPIWFVQVRDAFAFERMPEQSERVDAIFVSDMGASGAEWERPGIDNWVPAKQAFYVVGSNRRGGMGAPEFIPFAKRQDAIAFSMQHGGEVIAYAEVTDEAVLAPVDVELTPANDPRDGGS